MRVLRCDPSRRGVPRPFGEGDRRAGEYGAIPGIVGVDLGGRFASRRGSRSTERHTGNWNAFFAGMSAGDMRAMFTIYLALIVAGLVGFTLIGLLPRCTE